MDNPDMKKVFINEMVETQGWKILESWMNEKIDKAKERLVITEPNDIQKIVSCQEQIRTLKAIQNQIGYYINGK